MFIRSSEWTSSRPVSHWISPTSHGVAMKPYPFGTEDEGRAHDFSTAFGSLEGKGGEGV